MKRLKAVFGVVMLVLLFGVTTGFNLFTHICLMTGETAAAPMSMTADCCGNPLPDAPVTLSMNCCIEEVHFIKFDYNGATQTRIDQEAQPIALIPVELPEISPVDGFETFSSISLPPPLPGEIRDMQCVYRI